MNGHVDERVSVVLASLTRRADQRDDLEIAWKAATGAVEVLLWSDEFSRAASLSERLIHDLGGLGTELDEQRLPFSLAIAAAEVYCGEAALPRLRALASALPGDSVLGRHMARAAGQVQRTSALTNLGLHRPWDKPKDDLGRAERDLVARDWTTLSAPEFRRLWSAAQGSNDFELAEQIDNTVEGGPAEWFATIWYAQWLVHKGRIKQAAHALSAGRNTYTPRAPWSLLPNNPPVDVDLRPALTDEVRALYLADVHDPFAEVER